MSIDRFNAAQRLRDVIPPGIYDNSSNFVEFLTAYYDWLHTSTFDIDVLSGTFTTSEYIVGQTSKSTAKILQLKTGQLVVLVESSVPFIRGETIVAQTSGATGTLNSITDNILRTSSNLIDYRDLEKSVDKFADYLKFELYQSIPSDVSGDKFLLMKKIRDFYQSKSQESAYRYLFKSLFNQDIEIIYPGEEILRVSDGKFVQKKVLRTVVNANIFDFLFKTIRGSTSNAIANVVDIKLVIVGSIQVAEMTLSLVSGTFIGGETIFDISEPATITTLYGVISGFTINESGTGYSEGDNLVITGDGQAALASVSSVFKSPIDAIQVNATGYGYRLNTYATVDNFGTNGTGLIVKVTGIDDTYTVTSGPSTYTVGKVNRIQIVNRGYGYTGIPTITLEDSTIKNLGLLHEGLMEIQDSGNNYTVGDWLSFTSAHGSSANGIVSSVTEANTTLLLETESTLLLEDSYSLKNENATLIGPINRLRITNYGSGYYANSLPTVTVNTSTGSNANIIVLGIQGSGANVSVDAANNSGGIGSIRAISITDFGTNYTTATVDATGSGDGNANITPIISGIAISDGDFTNDDGKVDYKRIQDSYYYQDFSYVIRSGIEISTYKDVVKKIIHPAGLEVFGEIRIVSEFDLTMDALSEINLEHVGSLILELISQFQVKSEVAPNQKFEVDIIPPVITGTTISTIEPEKHIIAPKGIVAIDTKVDTVQDGELELDFVIEESAASQTVVDDFIEMDIIQNVDLSSERSDSSKLDVEMTLIGDVSSEESSDTFEIDIIPNTLNGTIETNRVTDIEITGFTDISSNLSMDEKTILLNENAYAKNIQLDITNEKYETRITLVESSNTEIMTPTSLLWGQIPISYEANTVVSTEASTTCLTPYYEYEPTYHSVLAYKKIVGTVSSYGNNTIIGIGTSFEIDFANGASMIIGDDKFVVSAISSNTVMTVLVDSTTNYSGSSAYKL